MIRKHLSRLSLPLLLMGLVGVITLGVAHNAAAITNNGLDANEFGGTTARYALENSIDVAGADNVTYPVYYLNAAATAAANSKPPTDMTISINDFGPRTNTTMQINTGSGWSASHNSNFSFTINKANFTYRPDINGWESSYVARLSTGSGRVQFRADITTPTGLLGSRGTVGKIGYSSVNGSAFASANRNRCDANGQPGCGQYYSYHLQFGTPCTETQPKMVYAYIYDGDNNSVGSNIKIQGKIKFTVQVYDATANNYPAISFSGGEGDKQTAQYGFTIIPKHKYQFVVNNVYANNVLQFKLPYDSINFLTNCNYDLTPSVTTTPSVSEPGAGTLTSTGYVTNSGNGASDTVNWQYTKCTVAPGANPAQYGTVADNTSNGVTTYTALGASCQQVSAGTGVYGQGLSTVTNTSLAIPDLPPGSRVCYVLSVNPPTNTVAPNIWRHSTPSCVLIGKKPKINILGGDVFVGRLFAGVSGGAPTSKIQTAVTIKTQTYGSSVEYAAAATGTITGLGSGSAYIGGVPSQTICSAGLLSLSNTPNILPCVNGPLGGYKTNNTIPDVSSAFVTTVSTPMLPASTSLDSLNGLYKAPASLTITGGTIAAGHSVIINAPNSDVTITGNIAYDTASLSDIDHIPQVVIIAKNIYIQQNVTQVDSWLSANGTLDTCSNGGVLTINVCNAQLTINGPVMAGKLLLNRTAGADSGAASANTAEVINLRPDAYLWGIYQASKSARLETTYSQELPPRF